VALDACCSGLLLDYENDLTATFAPPPLGRPGGPQKDSRPRLRPAAESRRWATLPRPAHPPPASPIPRPPSGRMDPVLFRPAWFSRAANDAGCPHVGHRDRWWFSTGFCSPECVNHQPRVPNSNRFCGCISTPSATSVIPPLVLIVWERCRPGTHNACCDLRTRASLPSKPQPGSRCPVLRRGWITQPSFFRWPGHGGPSELHDAPSGSGVSAHPLRLNTTTTFRSVSGRRSIIRFERKRQTRDLVA